jgi:hypothetical protein
LDSGNAKGFARKQLTLAELEDAVEEFSKTTWLAPVVVAEVLEKSSGG